MPPAKRPIGVPPPINPVGVPPPVKLAGVPAKPPGIVVATPRPVVQASPPAPTKSLDTEDPLRERNLKVAETLAEKLKTLNTQWSAIEKKLKEMQVPRYAYVRYNEHDLFTNGMGSPCGWEVLGLVRYGGEWRLCHGNDNEIEEGPPSWKPLAECSLEERVEAADHIDSLRLEIIQSAEKYVSKVETASAKLSSVLSKLQ